MIDIRKLKELVRLMHASDLTELDLRDKDEQVTIRRTGSMGVPHVVHAPPVMPQVVHHAAAGAAVAEPPAAGAGAGQGGSTGGDEGLVVIESPMVGTFYAAPGPDKPPFTQVGATVNGDTVVCLIEAMKIFNEIKAEQTGTIAKVLVQSGQAVEFGQPLFLVKPS